MHPRRRAVGAAARTSSSTSPARRSRPRGARGCPTSARSPRRRRPLGTAAHAPERAARAERPLRLPAPRGAGHLPGRRGPYRPPSSDDDLRRHRHAGPRPPGHRAGRRHRRRRAGLRRGRAPPTSSTSTSDRRGRGPEGRRRRGRRRRAAAAAGLRVTAQAGGHGATSSMEDCVLLRTHELRDVELDVRAASARWAPASAGASCTTSPPATGCTGSAGARPASASPATASAAASARSPAPSARARAPSSRSRSSTATASARASPPTATPRPSGPSAAAAAASGSSPRSRFACTARRPSSAACSPGRASTPATCWPPGAGGSTTVGEEVTSMATVMQVPPLPALPPELRGRSIVRVGVAILADEGARPRRRRPAARRGAGAGGRAAPDRHRRARHARPGAAHAASRSSSTRPSSPTSTPRRSTASSRWPDPARHAAHLRAASPPRRRPGPGPGDAGGLRPGVRALPGLRPRRAAGRPRARPQRSTPRCATSAPPWPRPSTDRCPLTFLAGGQDPAAPFRPGDAARLAAVKERLDPADVVVGNHRLPAVAR